MTRVLLRLHPLKGVNGTLFSFETVPEMEISPLLEDFGSLAKQHGWEVGGAGQLGMIGGPDNRLAGIWAPDVDVQIISSAIEALGHRVDTV